MACDHLCLDTEGCNCCNKKRSGHAAQARLLVGSVLIIGAGGLGSPAALYLTAAGAGRIGIIDQDVVELNNLHRQIIHSEERVGLHKAESAASACRALNSSNKVRKAFAAQLKTALKVSKSI